MGTTHYVEVADGAGRVELANGYGYNDGDIVALTPEQYAKIDPDSVPGLVFSQGSIDVDTVLNRFIATKLVDLDEATGSLWEFPLPCYGVITSIAYHVVDGPSGSGHTVVLSQKVDGDTVGSGVTLTSADVGGLTNGEIISGDVDAYFAPGDGFVVTTNNSDEGTNEVTRITLTADGGTFTVTYSAEESDPIPWDDSAAGIQETLEAVTTIGVGNVVVTRDGIEGDGDHIDIEWTGTKGETNITPPTTTVTDLELLGVAGDGTAVVSTVTGGVVDPSFTDGSVVIVVTGDVITEAAYLLATG